MAQAPAVIIVARHGPRLDAADQQWHLSTPTPYDPPLTYGGWNQCRALGLRIASLLHAREEKLDAPGEADGVTAYDFAAVNANGKRGAEDGAERRSGHKRRRVVKHKVVIHSSPFLRCLQTSTAIAAGLAQFNVTVEPTTGSNTVASENSSRSPVSSGRLSPRVRAKEGGGSSPRLSPIPEPKHDLVHEVARKALQERKRFRRSKLRVDAFLGEWLNPQYFEDITPPPPSSMMVKTAKAELMQNEAVEVFTPMVTSSGKASSANNTLWSGGGGGGAKMQSLDEWSSLREALPATAPTAVRESRSRASTVGSESGASPIDSGRRSPFRPGSVLSPLTSSLPKHPELSVYQPPTPQYAVSSSDQIPRGYVAHARNACANVDFQWDSSRAPLGWGDGGEYGEEWSQMHKRFRRGLGNLIEWYWTHGSDDRGEDALGFEQAESRREDLATEEEEDLVVIMVTHGAGCNALIGALTGQPVLLDVGTASLTMAVRKDDAPSLSNGTALSESPSPDHHHRDPALPALYDMHLVASSSHLRPTSSSFHHFSRKSTDLATFRDSFARNFPGPTTTTTSTLYDTPRGGHTGTTSALLGSIRRPSAAPFSAPGSTLPSRMNSSYPCLPGTSRGGGEASPPLSQGLWTPPSLSAPRGATPVSHVLGSAALSGGDSGARANGASRSGNGTSADGTHEEDELPLLDFSTSPPDSRPGTSAGLRNKDSSSIDNAVGNGSGSVSKNRHDSGRDQLASMPLAMGDKVDDGVMNGVASGDDKGRLERVRSKPPSPVMKRRWTVDERD